MKNEGISTAVLFIVLLSMASCDTENEMIAVNRPSQRPIPPPISAPGLVGTFSGTVQNISHTESGTLIISITRVDKTSGSLTGSLSLTGFSNCYTTGIFPDPSYARYSSYYSPGRGFGFIQASGQQPGSYSYLYFLASENFYDGLKLGVDDLGFYDGHNWCLSIDSAVLKRQ